MKRSELKEIIREEIRRIVEVDILYSEGYWKSVIKSLSRFAKEKLKLSHYRGSGTNEEIEFKINDDEIVILYVDNLGAGESAIKVVLEDGEGLGETALIRAGDKDKDIAKKIYNVLKRERIFK